MTMRADKRKKLEARGWKVGDADDFLELSPAESSLVDMKVSLARNLKTLRKTKRMSQQRLAKLLGSSQSRVAKIEACDRSVTMDMMVKSMLVMGATEHDIAMAIEPGSMAKVSTTSNKGKPKPRAKAKRKATTMAATAKKQATRRKQRPAVA
jgi:transcriptional regulator with XRE-family HTH domain